MAMINYEQNGKDLSLFLVYDHRINNQIEKISKHLFEDLLMEEHNIFI